MQQRSVQVLLTRCITRRLEIWLKTQIEGPQTAAESTENMADQTTEERVGKTAEYVRLETSYLPKGMVQSEEGKFSFEDNYMQGGVSMIVYQLTPEKTIADIENTGIAVSEETSIGGRPAVTWKQLLPRVIQQKILLQKELRMKIQPVQKKYI